MVDIYLKLKQNSCQRVLIRIQILLSFLRYSIEKIMLRKNSYFAWMRSCRCVWVNQRMLKCSFEVKFDGKLSLKHSFICQRSWPDLINCQFLLLPFYLRKNNDIYKWRFIESINCIEYECDDEVISILYKIF